MGEIRRQLPLVAGGSRGFALALDVFAKEALADFRNRGQGVSNEVTLVARGAHSQPEPGNLGVPDD
jgi:hypothetical protein